MDKTQTAIVVTVFSIFFTSASSVCGAGNMLHVHRARQNRRHVGNVGIRRVDSCARPTLEFASFRILRVRSYR